MSISVEILNEALEKTLSDNDIGLLLLHLKANGAVQESGEIDSRQFQIAMNELFGEGALIFFELVNGLSRKEGVYSIVRGANQ